MFIDYDKVKDIIRKHFYEIIKLMDKRQLSYDEIKELLVSTLYDVSLQKQNVREDVYVNVMSQLLHGPPPKTSEMEEIFADNLDLEHGDEFVPGTNIHKPREKKTKESDEEYLSYLEEYYGAYFPNEERHKAR